MTKNFIPKELSKYENYRKPMKIGAGLALAENANVCQYHCGFQIVR